MKCPKCGYIGFEAVDRCRNCGYEFALAVKAPQPDDLEMRSAGDPMGPLADLSLRGAPASPSRRRTPSGKEIDLNRIIGAPETAADLPLFQAHAATANDPEAPLIARPPAARKPLAVRRGPTPTPLREERAPTAASRENLELPLPGQAPAAALPADHGSNAARPVPRVLAAALDVLLLGGIDVLVLYFTVRLCSLSLGEVTQLPVAPLLAFLLLLNGGYLVAFTAAGGQTIGKMAFGLKVVGPGDTAVPVAAATLRSAGSLVSALCLGAGLVPALFGGRALHDRLADTRVVHITL